MSRSCQQIVDAARSGSTLNSVLVKDRVEMLTRIADDQRKLFADTNDVTRDFFQETDVVASSSASSERVIDLTPGTGVLTRELERILLVRLANSGEEISQVDTLDVDAEYPPRYQVQGQTLAEVENDWLDGAGAVSLKITYSYGPTIIDVAGDLTQLISIPDDWTDLLVLPLKMHLVQKDPGRPQGEYERLEALLKGKMASWLDFVKHRGGIEVRRFQLPVPGESGKE